MVSVSYEFYVSYVIHDSQVFSHTLICLMRLMNLANYASKQKTLQTVTEENCEVS